MDQSEAEHLVMSLFHNNKRLCCVLNDVLRQGDRKMCKEHEIIFFKARMVTRGY